MSLSTQIDGAEREIGVEGASWWGARRLNYNLALLVAGLLAFIGYCIVCATLLPRVLDASEIEVSLFTTAFQGLGYLVFVAIANLCYSLGPLGEKLFRPTDINRYRRIVYSLGFWSSIAIPLAIPVLLAMGVLFFPEAWSRR